MLASLGNPSLDEVVDPQEALVQLHPTLRVSDGTAHRLPRLTPLHPSHHRWHLHIPQRKSLSDGYEAKRGIRGKGLGAKVRKIDSP